MHEGRWSSRSETSDVVSIRVIDTIEVVRRTATALLLFALATACTSSPSALDTSTTTSSEVVQTTQSMVDDTFTPQGYETITTSDGRRRSYRIVDLAGDEPAPVIFVLHGFGGNAEGMRAYAGIEDAVETSLDDGAFVVYPNGTGVEEGLPQSWNAGGCCPFATYDLVDDVAFFAQLIDRLSAQYDIDAQRVWVVGHSNGGMMAYRLACELSSRVTAIAVAAGALMVDDCAPTSEVSAIHLHGDLDAVVPINGGETAGIVFPTARDSFSHFASAQSCPLDGLLANCPGGAVVSLVTNSGWTHDWQREWTSLIIDFLVAQSRG